MVAWLAERTSKSATCELLRVAWRTVGAIIARVNNDVEQRIDRLDGLRRIGIDEISYKRGHRYLIVVVDHDTGCLVWAGPGRNDTALQVFFDELGEERAGLLTHVSADMADWIARVVAKRAPNAVRCADPFHVVAWGIEALDVERRRAWNQASGRRNPTTSPYRRGKAMGTSLGIARARYALWKNPGDLTDNQRTQLEWIAKTDPRLHRAYLLKVGLRFVFAVKATRANALDRWLSWARRSRMQSFVKLARKITKHRDAIDHALDSGLSNGLIESTTPRSGSSPASRSGSTDPNPSSPSPCSPSAAIHPASQAESDPQIKHKGRICVHQTEEELREASDD